MRVMKINIFLNILRENKFFPHINLSEKEGEKALLLSDHQSKLLS